MRGNRKKKKERKGGKMANGYVRGGKIRCGGIHGIGAHESYSTGIYGERVWS